MNDFSHIRNVDNQLSSFSNLISAPVLEAIQEQSKQAERVYSEILAPSIEAYDRMNKSIVDSVQGIMEVTNKFTNLCKTISDFQMRWLEQIPNLAETLGAVNVKTHDDLNQPVLLYLEGKYVYFSLNVKKVRKSDSIHLLVLRALLYESDEVGFISYEKLDQYLVKNGLKEKDDRRARNKRILDALKDFPRFLGVPREYEGQAIIDVIEGEGIKLNNVI